MKLCSTKNSAKLVALEEAIFNSLPQDNGLYVPTCIPQLSKEFLENIEQYSFQEIALEVTKILIGDDIPITELKKIIAKSFDFSVPLINLDTNIYALELFHGPTLAFKDFGARFMAHLMSYYLSIAKNKRQLTILVATSGDTGSAVAQAFLAIPNIKVYILYPSKQISKLQEQQLTTLGQNITSIEIDGTFDDCQKIVKEAFLDQDLSNKINLSSANSINIARLIPQSFYYFYAYAKLIKQGKPLVFSVPCGNFGNLCGGVLAKKMGLPIHLFIASTNINDIVPNYLQTGVYTPKISKHTIANAMDVGNPSNFARLNYFYNNDINKMRSDLIGYSYTDKQISEAIIQVSNNYSYIMDPHGAIAYLGLIQYMKNSNIEITGVFLETAHPAKFNNIIDDILINQQIKLPKTLIAVLEKTKQSIKLPAAYCDFKDFLLNASVITC